MARIPGAGLDGPPFARRAAAVGSSPLVSIILAVYDPPIGALTEQLEAIANQSDPRWECIVIDDAAPSPEVKAVLAAWTAADLRRSLVTRDGNGGIAAATNDGLERATGEFVTICDHDDLIAPDALDRVVAHFDDHPDHDLAYSDEEMIDDTGFLVHEYCKPDFSPWRLLGQNYFSHLTVIRRAAIGDIRLRAAFEPAQDYDFFLRVVEGITAAGRGIGHIPRSLYSWRAVAGSIALDTGEKRGVTEAVRRCVESALERRGISGTVVPAPNSTTAMHHHFPASSRRSELIEIGPTTTAGEVAARVSASTADVVCLAPVAHNIDAMPTWPVQLVELLDRPDVGAAGPRLANADGVLLSAGRAVMPTLHDPFRGADASLAGPWDAFTVTREVTSLAPLGLALDREAVAAVGGIADDVGLDAAVTELCARLRDAGYATLYTPTAELTTDADAVPDPRDDRRVDDDISRVSVRVPHIRDERFAPTGTAPLVGYVPAAATKLRRSLASGTVELVTSDVFDTIVDRDVSTPSDVFLTLGRTLRARGWFDDHITPELFVEMRIDAEHRVRARRSDDARARHADLAPAALERIADIAAPECSLEEIWAEMPALRTDPARAASDDELIAAELGNEVEHLRLIEPTIEALGGAVDRDVTVHLVSDIYLSADQLRELLRQVGVDERLLAHITTSADHGMGKAHGLLRQVFDAHGVDTATAVHVGDNPIADVATAEELGAVAVATDVLPIDRHVPMVGEELAARSRALATDGGIRSTIRAALVQAGSPGVDPSFQFGAAIAGPAMAGFAAWVSATTEQLGATTVHCLLREGATLADMLGIVAPDGPRPVLVHASRWVNMRAAVIEGTPDELLTALARRAPLTPDHVAASFGCDVDRVTALLGSSEVPHSHLAQACRKLAADHDVRASIVAASAALRGRLVDYLRSALVIDDSPIVVADVGWGGTIQEGLTRVLRAEGVDNDVVGLYFALSAPGEARLRRGARMMSYLPNAVDHSKRSRVSRVVSHNAEVIERILTPQLGTLVDIDEGGRPVCRPDDDDHIPATLESAQIGMHDVVRRLAAQPGGVDTAFFVDDALVRHALGAAIADVIERPTEATALALGSWPHDDVAGTAHRSITGHVATAVRFANAHDIGVVDPSETAWISGVAAVANPVLAAQLSASARGVPPHALCPAGENGWSSLAAFPIDSELAELLDEGHARTGARGWSVARVNGPVQSLRAVQFTAATEPVLVDVGAFEIIATDTSGVRHRLDVTDLTDRALRWSDARPIDSRRFATGPGGHVVVPIDAELAGRIRRVDVTLGFRVWPLTPDGPLMRPPLWHAVNDVTRRVGGAVARRLRS
ncbi:MAG: glycosyltransferase [Ilumatobacter sp.]|nr:glycosyltransferase [Ilumatobacter sp.]